MFGVRVQRAIFFLIMFYASANCSTSAFISFCADQVRGRGIGAGFGVDDLLQDALSAHFKVRAPNSIQAEALPIALDGRNVAVVAQTGSGKTLTFLLPILQSILDRKKGFSSQSNPNTGNDVQNTPLAIVLAPTELLVEQHRYVAEQLLPHHSCHVMFTTPTGLLEDHTYGNVSFKLLTTVAIDEVDAVLYENDKASLTLMASSLLNILPKNVQFILTTAYLTACQETALLHCDFAGSAFVREHVDGRAGVLVPTLRQCFKYFSGNKENKLMDVLRDVEDDDWLRLGSTILLCNSVSSAKDLSHRIETEFGINVALLHDGLEASSRKAVLTGLRGKQEAQSSECAKEFIVCTGIAARGLDVPNVRHVILFDVPTDISGFIHQAGRTARRGQQGLITCLVKTGSGDYARYSHLHALKDASKLHFASDET